MKDLDRRKETKQRTALELTMSWEERQSLSLSPTDVLLSHSLTLSLVERFLLIL